jgi:hypothetical protein
LLRLGLLNHVFYELKNYFVKLISLFCQYTVYICSMQWIPLLMLALQVSPSVGAAATVQQVSTETRTIASFQTMSKCSKAAVLSTNKVTAMAAGNLELPYQKAAADDNAFWSHLGISSWISMGIAAALLIYGIVHRLFFPHSYTASGRRRNPSRV